MPLQDLELLGSDKQVKGYKGTNYLLSVFVHSSTLKSPFSVFSKKTTPETAHVLDGTSKKVREVER